MINIKSTFSPERKVSHKSSEGLELEAANRPCSVKKELLKILQNS